MTSSYDLSQMHPYFMKSLPCSPLLPSMIPEQPPTGLSYHQFKLGHSLHELSVSRQGQDWARNWRSGEDKMRLSLQTEVEWAYGLDWA